jgi:nicotinamidase-related amidase
MAHSIKKLKHKLSKRKINKRNKTRKPKRRTNKYRGGLREYTAEIGVQDTTKLLDHYLVKRIHGNSNFTKILKIEDYNKLPITAEDLLIVIDMQNDFVDRAVEKNGEQQLTGPEIPEIPEISEIPEIPGIPRIPRKKRLGAFCVNNGVTIIQPIVDFAKKCYTQGGNVVFTRDVHTCDHCSFFTAACPKDYPNEKHPKGPFPPHCINKTVGSGLVQEMKDYLSDKTISDTIDANSTGNISVVFKGCDQGTDSFGAIEYREDPYGRARQIACTPETLEKTGAFYANTGYNDKSVATDEFDVVANVDFTKKFTIPDSIENIYIVGLAGDFCVCDTAINLKKQYPDKNVSIIYELTRNAFIPFKPDKDSEKPTEDEMATLLTAVQTTDTNKKLDDYAFEVGANGTRSLSPEELNNLTVETLGPHFHFLTDIEELFARYAANGVKVIVNPTTISKAETAIASSA